MLTRFKWLVIGHIVLLLLIMAGVFYVLPNEELAPIAGVLVLVFIGFVWNLFRLVNRTNRTLANFLLGIKYDDFGAKYKSVNQEVSEKELFKAFNLISDKFQDIRLEKEIQFQYFEALVEQVQTGLIGFDDEGKTIFMNQALKKLLHKSFFPTFKSVKKFDPELYTVLKEVSPGNTTMVKKTFGRTQVELSIQMTILTIKGRSFSFYSFQNIHEELQRQEVNSWHKLIRILTHEIMNSVTPVVSLANTTNDMLKSGEKLDDDTREEVRAAVSAIQKRSEGLLHFTSTYRKLTKLPPPHLVELNAQELLDRILLLMQGSINEKGIKLVRSYSTAPVLFQGDPDLLEQAMINLIKNAVEAISGTDNPVITISIEQIEGQTIIRISDSGPGIPEEVQSQIFVPFYTTKEDGSGIGLSLCRQIIQAHGGRISLFSAPGQGTEFSLFL